MGSPWWSCVLGLLCMAAEVAPSTWTVFQSPSTTSEIKVNSSAEITCSISSGDVISLCLFGKFHGKRNIAFLSFGGAGIKSTTAAEFKGRIQVTLNNNVKEGVEVTLLLSPLRLSDTDLYYCEWQYMNSLSRIHSMSSNGTIFIVREYEECTHQIFDHILISFSVAAFTIIVFFFIGTMVLKYRRFKRNFRPARVITPTRPNRPHHVCVQQSNEHHFYWITSGNNLDNSDDA